MSHTRVVSILDDVERVEQHMRAAGWADHTSVSREQQVWARLSAEVGNYTSEIDDYTNGLCSRDYLAKAADIAPADLRDAILLDLASADARFRSATVEDHEGRLGRFYRIASGDGWWWHRRPATGPLAEALAERDTTF